MGNPFSKKGHSKTKIKTETNPTASLTSQKPGTSPSRLLRSERSDPPPGSTSHQVTSSAASSSTTNAGPSEIKTTPVRQWSKPLTLDDKKQILIEALKEKYKDQYDAVQPIPYIKDRLYCVDKIFVEGGVSAAIGSASSYGKDASWERLDSYKKIFNDPRLKSNRRIIEGEPGYGKSTLTLQLAYDWCNGVLDSPLSDVEILILLRLRQFGPVTSIAAAIKWYLIPKEDKLKIRDIRDILKSCKSVAFQLDGYDEYRGKDSDTGNDVGRMIMCKLFLESDVTLTTRYLPKEFDRSETKRVKLTGFDDTARDQYIRKAVAGNDEAAVDKVKKGLKENVILDDLCQVPLFFAMFAHMTHENKDFQKFKSVTDFLRYMMKCFHSHTRNKSDDYNAKKYSMYLEANHDELDKIAFEALSKKDKQIVWGREELCKRLGQEFYDYYISIGILVEEEAFDATDEQTPGKIVMANAVVSFYHKIFCEWFGSFRMANIVENSDNSAEIQQTLSEIDPFDTQYLYRFACGINPRAGSKIIEYLKNRRDGDKFAILCILEQNGEFDDISKTVRKLCSETIYIKEHDSKLLQRSTVQLLQIASSRGIKISELNLRWSFSKVDKADIVLKSGICVPSLSSLEKIQINEGSGNLISEEDVIGLINYGLQSERFKELWLDNCELPTSFRSEKIPETAKSRNIKVLRSSHASQLDLRSGEWTQPDDIQTITELCAGGLTINRDTSDSAQRSVVDVLVKASNNDIPIYGVNLARSFNKVDGDNISLLSGLSLPILTSLERMGIQTEDGREMNQQEVNGILNYVQQSPRIKQLE